MVSLIKTVCRSTLPVSGRRAGEIHDGADATVRPVSVLIGSTIACEYGSSYSEPLQVIRTAVDTPRTQWGAPCHQVTEMTVLVRRWACTCEAGIKDCSCCNPMFKH